MKKETNAADGTQKPDELVKKTRTKVKPKNINAIRELETCLEISANILKDVTGMARNSYYRTNTLEYHALIAIEKLIRNNTSVYEEMEGNKAFGGLIKINIPYYKDLIADALKMEAQYTTKDEHGEDVEMAVQFNYDSDPEVEKSETEDALYELAMAQKHGDKASLVAVVGDKSILDVLQSSDLYNALFDDVKIAYITLSSTEQMLFIGRLEKIQGRLLQISRNIIRNGAGIVDSDRVWFELVCRYIDKIKKLTGTLPNDAKDAKYRTLLLYLYLSTRNNAPEKDFSGKTSLYKFIARIVGSTPYSVKEYILALGQTGIDYKIPKHFEDVKASLLAEFADSPQEIKEGVKKLLEAVRRPL